MPGSYSVWAGRLSDVPSSLKSKPGKEAQLGVTLYNQLPPVWV